MTGRVGPHPADDGSTGVGLHVNFPNCVAVDTNGEPVLSSPGGMSHVAYDTGACPASHPYLIPTLTITVFYRLDPNSGWYLASDRSPISQGDSLHADYIAGWPNEAMDTITRCVAEARRECSPSTDFEERYLAPSGERVYQDPYSLAPGVDQTPFDFRLMKELGGHSH